MTSQITGRVARCGVVATSIVLTTMLGAGCLSRPVTGLEPTTKVSILKTLADHSVDKIDILFAIDNSASMGDKQDFLALAVPDLISRLVSPYCVDDNGVTIVAGGVALTSDQNGVCTQGQAEFKPIQDMHIAIVSSSLGLRGGDICDPASGAHMDDHGQLLNRDANNAAVPDANPGNFLAWFPAVTANAGKIPANGATAITDVTTLDNDFKTLVQGANEDGCGIESQLESWYRFLIQPDPYNDIIVSGKKASWDGVDQVILKQRHDFLRPDSLVAVIVLTDENDSEVDVRAAGGTGYNFHLTGFTPPHGTAACATDPTSPSCVNCGPSSTDPNCMANGGVYTAANDWGYDPNLRHVHMKAKYGLDPQYPITRYVDGLSKTTIPDRTGEYPSGAFSYVGNADCTNPLFASSLPDGTDTSAATLCNLPQGTRPPGNIFYGIIGGVPYQLLNLTPDDPTSVSAPLHLSDSDWQKILGNDPESFDYSGIDPHMIESYQPRTGLPGPASANNADPINGREWVTNPSTSGAQRSMPFNVDRQYACIFPLATPRDCTSAADQRGCDCPTDPALAPTDPTLLPPVCNASKPTEQVAAKVYPTPREILLAKKLASQGIVASLCPVHTTDNATGSDPFFGYRPAVAAIVDRLKNALQPACLPDALTPTAVGDAGAMEAPCLVLATLAEMGDESQCNMPGLSIPPSDILTQFIQNQISLDPTAASTIGRYPICEVNQIATPIGSTCKTSTDVGWCYVQNSGSQTPAGSCPRAVLFTAGATTALTNATFSLQCINQYGAGAAAGDDAGSTN